MTSPDELRAELQRVGLRNHVEALLSLARFATRIDASACAQEALPSGASRFGGMPDLPDDLEWPMYKGKPQTFLAQLDLSVLPPGSRGLPDAGWLVFFYECETMEWGFDPEHRGCAAVRYLAPTQELKRRAPPIHNQYTDAFRPCSLSFGKTLDPPDPFDRLCDPVCFSKEEGDVYFDLLAEIATPGYHHLVGHPQLIQNDMRLECQLVSNGVYCGDPDGYKSVQAVQLQEGWRDWELLLQLDSDDNGPGWVWGDYGRIYFWMRSDDLRACRFEQSWLVLQCS